MFLTSVLSFMAIAAMSAAPAPAQTNSHKPDQSGVGHARMAPITDPKIRGASPHRPGSSPTAHGIPIDRGLPNRHARIAENDRPVYNASVSGASAGNRAKPRRPR